MRNDHYDFILHVGYPKSASSFLKRGYFAARDCNFIVPRKDLLSLIRAEELRIEELRQVMQKDITAPEKPTVVSNEILVGNSFWTSEGAEHVAANMAKTFPGTRVVMVIREQASYILSAYKYSVYTGHYIKPFDEFIREHRQGILEKLKYHQYISHYQNVFGKDRVLVLPVEQLKLDRDAFYERLDVFTGLHYAKSNIQTVENISPASWTYIEFLRKSNWLLRYLASAERFTRRLTVNNTIHWNGHKIIAYRLIVDSFARFFDKNSRYQGSALQELINDEGIRLSNRETEKLTGLPLRDLGYLQS